MSPTLRPGTIVIALPNRRAKVGDIVIVMHAGREKIKRLTAADARGLYVEGDNPVASTDSRQFGWLPETALIGALVWPRAGRSTHE